MKKYFNSPDSGPQISPEARALISVAARVSTDIAMLMKQPLRLKETEPELVAGVRRRVEALLALLK